MTNSPAPPATADPQQPRRPLHHSPQPGLEADVQPAARLLATDMSVLDEWKRLADEVDGSPFHRPDWFRTWWRAFGTGTPELVTARRGGRLVAVMPVARHHTGRVASLSNWHSFVFGPLATDAEAADELVAALLRRPHAQLELSHLDPDDVERMVRLGGQHRHRIRTTRVQRSPYVPQGTTVEEYLDRREPRRVRQLERNRAKLHAAGTVSFAVHGKHDDLEWALAELFRVEGMGWKGESGTAIVSHPDTERFYRDTARWAADAGLLRIPLLQLDGRVIAGEICVENGQSHFSLKAGHDPNYRQFTPGLIVQLDMIRATLDAGKSYEFLGAGESYKKRWADHAHDINRVQLFPPTLPGHASYLANLGGRAARKGLHVGRDTVTAAVGKARALRRSPT
ncbi:GNAT family N-acetyltransferase [Pseudonocardia sp. TRM90224]|uniref:GNAT family N-acetyltransferase n=1 Tax=Pseudonocardia sp. TRM90224 TaxID=2812678 RepID=UPI001E4E83BD|nr:GNAT family N-acetyltransferase [Pseudonocardia sp. TRM90224]